MRYHSNKIKCLSLIKGNVKKIDKINSALPIINWIKIESRNKNQILKNKKFYFAHSYYCDLSVKEKNYICKSK